MRNEREEYKSGPPEDKDERLQGIRHLNEPNHTNHKQEWYLQRNHELVKALLAIKKDLKRIEKRIEALNLEP